MTADERHTRRICRDQPQEMSIIILFTAEYRDVLVIMGALVNWRLLLNLQPVHPPRS